jgi:hypothetical protein
MPQLDVDVLVMKSKGKKICSKRIETILLQFSSYFIGPHNMYKVEETLF